MPQTRNAATDETIVLVRTGATRLKAVIVRQRTVDAPALTLKLWNAAEPVAGTDAAFLSIPIPAGRTQVDCTDLKITFSGKQGGLIFSTALSYAVTTLNTVTDVAPDAGDEPEVIIQWEPLG